MKITAENTSKEFTISVNADELLVLRNALNEFHIDLDKKVFDMDVAIARDEDEGYEDDLAEDIARKEGYAKTLQKVEDMEKVCWRLTR